VAISNMFEALVARGPALSLGKRSAAFNRLVGSWDVEVFDIEPDGAKRVTEGEWHFAWVLEGRALQDVLIVPRRADRHLEMPLKGNRYVSALRLLDRTLDAWRVFFVDPLSGAYIAMVARVDGEQVIEEGRDLNGDLYRKVFSDLTDDSFRTREEVSLDDGATWQETTHILARRAV
jgi:hypothetical protein